MKRGTIQHGWDLTPKSHIEFKWGSVCVYICVWLNYLHVIPNTHHSCCPRVTVQPMENTLMSPAEHAWLSLSDWRCDISWLVDECFFQSSPPHHCRGRRGQIKSAEQGGLVWLTDYVVLFHPSWLHLPLCRPHCRTQQDLSATTETNVILINLAWIQIRQASMSLQQKKKILFPTSPKSTRWICCSAALVKTVHVISPFFWKPVAEFLLQVTGIGCDWHKRWKHRDWRKRWSQ